VDKIALQSFSLEYSPKNSSEKPIGFLYELVGHLILIHVLKNHVSQTEAMYKDHIAAYTFLPCFDTVAEIMTRLKDWDKLPKSFPGST
jgi:hypothetical protein